MRITLVPLFVATLLLPIGEAIACQCQPSSGDLVAETKAELGAADTVVYAEAIKIRDWWGLSSVQRVRWRVLKSWKGQLRVAETFETVTESACCVCGVAVKRGEKHLFYLSEGRAPSVMMCSLSEKDPATIPEQLRILDSLVVGSIVAPPNSALPRTAGHMKFAAAGGGASASRARVLNPRHAVAELGG